MSQPIPETTAQSTASGKDGIQFLKYAEQSVPGFGDSQVLVNSKYNILMSNPEMASY